MAEFEMNTFQLLTTMGIPNGTFTFDNGEVRRVVQREGGRAEILKAVATGNLYIDRAYELIESLEASGIPEDVPTLYRTIRQFQIPPETTIDYEFVLCTEEDCAADSHKHGLVLDRRTGKPVPDVPLILDMTMGLGVCCLKVEFGEFSIMDGASVLQAMIDADLPPFFNNPQLLVVVRQKHGHLNIYFG